MLHAMIEAWVNIAFFGIWRSSIWGDGKGGGCYLYREALSSPPLIPLEQRLRSIWKQRNYVCVSFLII